MALEENGEEGSALVPRGAARKAVKNHRSPKAGCAREEKSREAHLDSGNPLPLFCLTIRVGALLGRDAVRPRRARPATCALTNRTPSRRPSADLLAAKRCLITRTASSVLPAMGKKPGGWGITPAATDDPHSLTAELPSLSPKHSDFIMF
jgi:hypothetical protein